jgi:hypothetical protein
MQKFLVLVAIMLMAVGISFADNEIWTYQTINTSGTVYTNTAIPVTSIYPLIDEILGYSVMHQDPTKSAETVVALYDQTSVSILSGECLGESESQNKESLTNWYPYPRTVQSGLMVRQGPNTVVTIYFSRR